MRSNFISKLISSVGSLFKKKKAAVAGLDETQLRAGDVVFTRTGGPLFSRVGSVSGSWCSHVGIVIGKSEGEWQVAESKVPVVCTTPLRRFVGRSEAGLYEVRRLPRALRKEEVERLKAFVMREQGRFYDTGFNWESERSFCSKFVRQALEQATGQAIGEVECFKDLLAKRSGLSLSFWRLWYFGRIPWGRKTITPANLLQCAELHTVFRSQRLEKSNGDRASSPARGSRVLATHPV